MEFQPGDRITHPYYGDGTLVTRNDFHTVIEFDAHGRRTFLSPRVALTMSSSAVPARRVPSRSTVEGKWPGSHGGFLQRDDVDAARELEAKSRRLEQLLDEAQRVQREIAEYFDSLRNRTGTGE